MAIYHLSAQVIGKSSQRSAIAAAAYRAGEKLVERVVDRVTGTLTSQVHDYSDKAGVVYKTIIAPVELPRDSWVYDREELWNRVHEAEIRKDAQFCREMNIALPVELSQEENINLIENFVTDKLVSEGMIVDLTVHCDNKNNPHAHIMMTMRNLVVEGDNVSFGLKNTQWNRKDFLEEIRETWAQYANYQLELGGFSERISHESYEDRGIDLIPTLHEGPSRHMQGRIAEQNLDIHQKNAEIILEDSESLLNSISKIVFTYSDIEKKLSDRLKKGFHDDIKKLSALPDKEQKPLILLALSKIISSDKIVKLGAKNLQGEELYATATRINEEKEYISQLEYFSGQNRFSIDGEIAITGSLSLKQQQVVEAVLRGQDMVIIEGLPGAGKTTVMKEISKIYKEQGFNVVGGSISSVATRHLGSTAEIETRTIASWKFNFKKKDLQLPEKTIFVIDEAGMLDLDSAKTLFEKLKDSKIILLGDTNQFSAIGSKGALAKAVDICGSYRLDEVRRQENELHRLASVHLSNYKVKEAFDIYAKTGVLCIAEDNELKPMVYAYLKDFLEDSNELIPTSVMLAYRNVNVNLLNSMVRQELIKMKMLEQGSKIYLNIFEINLEGIEEGVKGAREKPELIEVKNLNLSKGDIVLFKHNDKRIGVMNGQRGKVKDISVNRKGFATLTVDIGGEKDIMVDTSEYGYLTHGYAMTSHKSQGSTYKNVHVLYESLVRYEAFNVMMTRHQKEVKLYLNRSELIENLKGKENKQKELEEKEKFANKSFEEKEVSADNERKSPKSVKDLMTFRGSDLELVYSALIENFSKKDSQLLALDYVKDDKFNKVYDFVKLDADVKNAHYIDGDNAEDYLLNVNKRYAVANEIRTNISDYKEYVAATEISFDKIIDPKNLDFGYHINNLKNKVGNKYFLKDLKEWYKEQKELKVQSFKLMAEIILIQRKLDKIDMLDKQVNILKLIIDPKEAFEQAYKDPVAALELFYRLEDTRMDIYKAVHEKPYLLGKLHGFDLLIFKSGNRKESIAQVQNAMKRGIMFEETSKELKESGCFVSLTTELKEAQKQLSGIASKQASTKDFESISELVERHKELIKDGFLQGASMINDIRNGYNKDSLRFQDMKLESQDYINIFKEYANKVNSDGEIIMRGNQLQCGSLSMNIENGLWFRFSTGQKGNIYDFLQYATGCDKKQALELVSKNQTSCELAQTPKSPSIKTADNSDKGKEVVVDKWKLLSPLPQGLALDPSKNLNWVKHKIDKVFEYKNKDGQILGYTLRILDQESGRKQVLPLSYWSDGERQQWRLKGFGNHLYGAEKLGQANYMDKPVLIVEGEKTCDAAQKLLSQYCVVAFPGANRTKSVDWTILKDKEVIIWPDNDVPGITAAKEIVSNLKDIVASSKIVDTSAFPNKWDLADKLEDLEVKRIAEVAIKYANEPVTPLEINKYQEKLSAIKALGKQDNSLGESLKYLNDNGRKYLLETKLSEIRSLELQDKLSSYLKVRFGIETKDSSWKLVQESLDSKIESIDFSNDMTARAIKLEELKAKNYIEYSLLKSGKIDNFQGIKSQEAIENLKIEVEAKYKEHQTNLSKPISTELIEEVTLVKQLEHSLNRYNTFGFKEFNTFSKSIIRCALYDLKIGLENTLEPEKLVEKIIERYDNDIAKQFQKQFTRSMDLTR